MLLMYEIELRIEMEKVGECIGIVERNIKTVQNKFSLLKSDSATLRNILKAISDDFNSLWRELEQIRAKTALLEADSAFLRSKLMIRRIGANVH